MSPNPLEEQVERLRQAVARLEARVRFLEDPRGRLFIGLAGPNDGEFTEEIPTDDGQDLQTLDGGRDTTGTGTNSGLLAIPLNDDEFPVLGFQNGTNAAYVNLSRPRLRYGKITALDDCLSQATVHRCRLDGTILDTTDVTVYPVFGNDAQAVASGFVWSVGEVIAYTPLDEDPTQGIQDGAYKSVSVGYRCSDSNSASVPGLNGVSLYNSDFFLKAASDCGASSGFGSSNVAQLGWRGFIVTAYSVGSIGGGATNLATGMSGVKELNFDSTKGPPPSALGGTLGTDYTNLFFKVTSGATSANVPTLGGSSCPADDSAPLKATVQIEARLGTMVSSISGVTCNEDGTITVNYATARCLIP